MLDIRRKLLARPDNENHKVPDKRRLTKGINAPNDGTCDVGTNQS